MHFTCILMMNRCVRTLLFATAWLLCLLAAGSSFAAGKNRFALVIGNGGYERIEPLPNPARDAADMADTLSRLGFEVTLGIDLDHARFARFLEDFVLRSAGAGEVVFYYGGHGFQLGKANHLVPVDAGLKDRNAIADETIQLDRVITSLRAANRRIIIFLDACRNNPLPKNLRDRSAQGLAEIDAAGSDLFVAFATEPGKVARDGKDGNSPFTRALLTHMVRPALGIAEMMLDVRKDVYAVTDGAQLPWDQSSLRSQFYFSPTAAANQLALRSQAEIPEVDGDTNFVITEGPESEPETTPNAAGEPTFGTAAGEPDIAPDQPKSDDLQVLEPVPDEPIAAPDPESNDQPPALEPPPGDQASAEAPPPITSDGSFNDCESLCPAMIRIKSGDFRMGSAEAGAKEAPVHEVAVKAFALGRNEITVAEWQACVDAGACKDAGASGTAGGSDTPVHNITWDQAVAYTGWLSTKTGQRYRLPSEAEWEYAARAGTATRYSGSEDASAPYVDCKDCGGEHKNAAPRGKDLLPNEFGVAGMSGGVAEWVMDCWKPDYVGAPADGSARGGECNLRVLRGGSWRDARRNVTVSSRAFYDHDVPYPNNGLRVARDLDQ